MRGFPSYSTRSTISLWLPQDPPSAQESRLPAPESFRVMLEGLPHALEVATSGPPGESPPGVLVPDLELHDFTSRLPTLDPAMPRPRMLENSSRHYRGRSREAGGPQRFALVSETLRDTDPYFFLSTRTTMDPQDARHQETRVPFRSAARIVSSARHLRLYVRIFMDPSSRSGSPEQRTRHACRPASIRGST